MWASFRLRNIILKFFLFWRVALRFRELTYSNRAHKLEKGCFLHARYLENEVSLNYGTLHDIPEQNCLRNLERFRQSLLTFFNCGSAQFSIPHVYCVKQDVYWKVRGRSAYETLQLW